MYLADGARVRDYTINSAVQVTYLLADWSAVTCTLLQHLPLSQGNGKEGEPY